MDLEEVNGFKEAQKERNSIPLSSYDIEKWECATAGPK